MMTYIYRPLGIVLASGLLLASCAEDKGNYSYRELTELEISGVDNELVVLTKNRLQLTPQLGTAALPDDRYEFEWKVISENIENNEEIVIGHSRNLDYEVAIRADVYTLFFTVKEKDSGIYWQQTYKLTVNDTTSEGWMVLCSDDGRARLDMISQVTGDTYTDLLKDQAEISQWKGPRGIQALPSGMTDAQSPFYYLTDEGATRLGRNNFEWNETYNFAYEAATGGSSLRPLSITVGGVGKMMVSGTDAYYCERGMGIDGLYQSAVNKDFEAGPYIGTNVSASQMYAAIYLLYDNTHKRFMAYCPLMSNPDLGGHDPLATMSEMEDIATNLRKENGVVNRVEYAYPEGYDLVYMENTKYDPGNGKMGNTYVVLSKEGKRYLYGIQLGDLLEAQFLDCSYALGKSYYGDLSACTQVHSPEALFAFSSLKNYMYYAVGSIVYRVDLAAPVLKAEPQFTLGGETITCLKFDLCQASSVASHAYDLIVGSVDRNGQGILRIYEGKESEGDFRSVVPERHTGFARIVDVIYRERDI